MSTNTRTHRSNPHALRQCLSSLDGRLVTARDLTHALASNQNEIESLLATARREGWVRTAGKNPQGATLYCYCPPA